MNWYFQFQENGTTLRREILAGLVTFATMAYIVCVQPAIMSGAMLGMNTGLDGAALVTTTCIASAFGCFLMGLASRYPFALAPGMGLNFFVVCELFPVCAKIQNGNVGDAAVWQLGLGAVFVAGAVFFLLSLMKVRSLLMNLVSPSMKMAICAGIGLFLAFLGLKNGSVLVITNNQPAMGPLMTLDVAVFAVGLFTATLLMVRKVPGAILIGILCAAIVAFCTGKLHFEHYVGMPANPSAIVGHLDIWGVFQHFVEFLPFIFVLTFMDIFDTFGTVIGVSHQCGFTQKDGSIPRLERIFLADATATMAGAVLGHSTVTTFVESTAGVESGGRTGMVSMVVGLLFLLCLFLSPMIVTLSGYGPITASALVLVGVMMANSLREVVWDDLTEAIPAFLTIVGIPFFNSISNGILCGLILYPILKLCTGRVKETSVGMFVLSFLLIGYLIFTA